MFIVDDPLLALIVRFVVNETEIEVSDEAFTERQIQALREHVAQFPTEQRNVRAIEWIERHAERYRRNWQKKTVSLKVSPKRCPDCPMSSAGGAAHCAIHAQWLALLAAYSADELSSRQYIEDALALLREHKKGLRLEMDSPAGAQAAGA